MNSWSFADSTCAVVTIVCYYQMLKLSPSDSLFPVLFLCHFSPSADTFESILYSSNNRMFQSHLDFSPAPSYGIHCPLRVLLWVSELKIWISEIRGGSSQARGMSCCFGPLLEVSEPENTSCFKVRVHMDFQSLEATYPAILEVHSVMGSQDFSLILAVISSASFLIPRGGRLTCHWNHGAGTLSVLFWHITKHGKT